MNILIYIVAAIVALVSLVLVLALFTKKGYTVERSIVINKPVNEVFDYVKRLKNQDYYNKWVMTDPNMTKTFTGTDGTVGFIYGWEGNRQAGQGEQEIKGITPNARVDMELRFVKPMPGIAQAYITTTAITESQTQVTWGMSSGMKYPMNIMLTLLNLEKMLGKDLEISLRMLKEQIE